MTSFSWFKVRSKLYLLFFTHNIESEHSLNCQLYFSSVWEVAEDDIWPVHVPCGYTGEEEVWPSWLEYSLRIQ